MTNQTTEKLDGYLFLLNSSYSNAIEALLSKYGPTKDDYYRESSYSRFLKGEIKNITKGRYQRTKEGLYCHHIDEIEFENLSNKDFIQKHRYPYSYQTKDRLVYCDLIEHLILHALITKETNGNRGFTGYITYIRPMVNDWYLGQLDPKPEWMKVCKQRATLPTKQLNLLLTQIDIIINKVRKRQFMKTIGYKELHTRLNLNMTIKQYKVYKVRKQEMKDELRSRVIELESENRRIKEREKTEKIIQQFYIDFPIFKKMKISPVIPRKKILNYLFEYKYKESFSTKKEFYAFKINILRDDLLKELGSILDNTV